jgi:regulator of sirC expression with transglutaminase-like and TPR domain
LPLGPFLDFALELARDFEPDVDAEVITRELDGLTQPWLGHGHRALSPRRQAEDLSMILFGLAGFGAGQGEAEPADFLIHKVLRRRRGNAGLLGVVYQAVAARLSVLVEPISAPNQLLWRVIDQHQPGGLDRAVIVDPGRNGEIVDIDELLNNGDEAWLAAARPQTWQRTVLDELRQLLTRRREFGGALIVLHRQCASEPNNPAAFRERGLLHRRLGAPLAAIEDLETYLSLAPHASDVQDVSETIDRVRDELHRAPRHRAN